MKVDDTLALQKKELENLKKFNAENSIEKRQKQIDDLDNETESVVTANVHNIITLIEGNIRN